MVYFSTIAVSFIGAIFFSRFTEGTIDQLTVPRSESFMEKVMILDVSFNPAEPRIVTVRAKAMASVNESNIVFAEAFVRNSLQDVVAKGVIVPNELPFNTAMLLTVNLNSTLTSGSYTVTLVTENNARFPSNLFAVA